MKPEKQRIAIAETCGWHHFIINDEYGPDRGLKPDQTASIGCVFTELPDYLNDLNAMHEAEKVLVAKDDGSHAGCARYVYASHLYGLVPAGVQPFMATAAQRAEAFLRAIGKWEEGGE